MRRFAATVKDHSQTWLGFPESLKQHPGGFRPGPGNRTSREKYGPAPFWNFIQG